jgi:hypothetical protein
MPKKETTDYKERKIDIQLNVLFVQKIKTFLVDVPKISVFASNNTPLMPSYPSMAYRWNTYLVLILNAISGKAWDFTSLFTIQN